MCPSQRAVSPVHTSCECERMRSEAWRHKFATNNSQLVPFALLPCVYRCERRVWRQIHVEFASHSHSQEVWTGLYTTQLWDHQLAIFCFWRSRQIQHSESSTEWKAHLPLVFLRKQKILDKTLLGDFVPEKRLLNVSHYATCSKMNQHFISSFKLTSHTVQNS